MSLPLTARWEYFAKLGTEAGSEESKLLEVLRESHGTMASITIGECSAILS